MPKKYMIRCDMEGVSGVVSYTQVEPGRPEYGEARENFMQELLVLVKGLQEEGAGEILIYDEHWFGRNLDIARLPAGVVGISGKPPYRADWAGGLDETFAGLIIHGLHSKANSGHLLHHTYEPDFDGIEINGVAVGEIGVEAAISGDFDVPVLLVIADSAGAEEARDLLPGVATVSTKQSQSPEGAECLPLCESLKLIDRAAHAVVTDPPAVRLFKFTAPITMTMDFREGPYLEALRGRAGDSMSSDRRLVLKGDSTVTEVWARYWALKLQCQQDIIRNNSTLS